MSAIWHDSGLPSFMAPVPIFSFHNLPEIHAEAPAEYAQAMAKMRSWEEHMGATWFQHNAELAHAFFEAKRPWWL